MRNSSSIERKILFCLMIGMIFLSPLWAQEPQHSISFEKVDRDPPLLQAMDVVTFSGDLCSLGLSAVLTTGYSLRTLTLVLQGKQAFSASGEIKWLFPDGESLTMFGKPSLKEMEAGMVEISITCVSGFKDFFSHIEETCDKGALLGLFSKDKVLNTVAIPPEFFALLVKPKS
jgi:hypothetical protein